MGAATHQTRVVVSDWSGERKCWLFHGKRWHSALARDRQTWRWRVRGTGAIESITSCCIFSTVDVGRVDPAPIESVEQIVFCAWVGRLSGSSKILLPQPTKNAGCCAREKKVVASTMFWLDCVVVLIKVITCRLSILQVDPVDSGGAVRAKPHLAPT